MKNSCFENINSIVIKYSTRVFPDCRQAGIIPLKTNTYYDETREGKFKEKN